MPKLQYNLGVCVKHMLNQQGIEPQPGPPKQRIERPKARERNYVDHDVTTRNVVLEVGNVSHAFNNRHNIAKRAADYFFGQEHSLPRGERSKLREHMKHWRIHMTELDEEAEHNLGGIFMASKGKKEIICPAPKGSQMKLINGKGRVQLYAIELARDVYVLIYNIYGWTNAAKIKSAAQRTDDIIATIIEDMEMQPPGPAFILGDLNGDINNFETLKQEVEEKRLVDVGGQAENWGAEPNEYTCKAPNANKPSRRDYIFANPEAFDLVDGFEVDHNAGFAVHDVLRMKLKSKGTHKTIVTSSKPKSLSEIPMKALAERFLEINRKCRQKESERTWKSEDKCRVRYEGDSDKPDSWIKQIQSDTERNEKQESVWPSLLRCQGDENKEELIDDETSTAEQVKEVKSDVHKVMDKLISEKSLELNRLLQEDDTEGFLKLWSAVIEDACIDFGKVEGKEADRYRGHGEVKLEERKVPLSGEYDKHRKEMKANIKNQKKKELVYNYEGLLQ
jgi:hypothetical protein